MAKEETNENVIYTHIDGGYAEITVAKYQCLLCEGSFPLTEVYMNGDAVVCATCVPHLIKYVVELYKNSEGDIWSKKWQQHLKSQGKESDK